MAALTTAAFLSKWNARFADNTTRDISEEDMREFVEDIKDSFSSVVGAVAVTSWKSPCAVATTANITLSGEQTIDGVLTSGSRVLVKNQTTQSQNGIYVSAAGAWSRSTDADAAAELEGAAVGVTQGTTQQNTVWLQTSDNITLGSTAIAWQQIGFGFSSGGVSGLTTDRIPKASSATSLADSIITESSNNIGVGTTSPDRKLHAEQDSATTNAVTYVQRITSTSSGTPANGIGVGIEFEVETSSANNEVGATIEAVTTDVTGGSEDFDLLFKLMAAGAAATEALKITSLGVLTIGTKTRIFAIGTNNLFIGEASGNLTLSGNTNTSVGINSLQDLTSGNNNVSLGVNAGRNITTGSANTALGTGALDAVTVGSSNVSVGNGSGFLVTGDFNCLFGEQAGANITSGNDNIVIGAQRSAPSATSNGQLVIQNIIFGTGNTNAGTTISTGNIGIGITSPATKLDVDGPVRVKSYTVAGVPSATSIAGAIIYVSNESGGAVLAFSDGTNWRRVTDRAIIS